MDKFIEQLKAGATFWAGEDIITSYQFKEHPAESGTGYITRDTVPYCDVKALRPEFMVVSYRFFGMWLESIIRFNSLAFSQAEIIARIQPVPVKKPVIKTELTRDEILQLVGFMNSLCEEIPNGLSSLKDALTFAMLDLSMFTRFGHKSVSYQNALDFAQSIPHFDDVKSDACTYWMLNDQEYLKYK